MLLFVASISFASAASAAEYVIKSTTGKLLEFILSVLNLLLLVFTLITTGFFPVV